VKVTCINNEFYGYELTKNKTYTVLYQAEDLTYIIDNTGRKYGYYNYRFSSIKEKKKVKEFGIVGFCRKMYNK
jgi:hypothetical protein